MTELKNAWALGLLVLPLALLWLARRRPRPALAVSLGSAFRAPHRSLRTRLTWLPFTLRLLALVACIGAVARPRLGDRLEDVITHGIDFVVALDVSGSMRAEDLRPDNRLQVAKEVVRQFIGSRRNDRIGLVVFAGKAVTLCPLTLDHALLERTVDAVSFNSVDEDGTAIGMATATATNRLRKAKAKSRVVVLVTDGINNRPPIDPITAAEAARALGIKVYTVGVGTHGAARIPVPTAHGMRYIYDEVPLDEETLQRIARTTGGYYFRATDQASFAEALRRIGELETTRIETREYTVYDELFAPFLAAAAALLALEGMLSATWLARLP